MRQATGFDPGSGGPAEDEDELGDVADDGPAPAEDDELGEVAPSEAGGPGGSGPGESEPGGASPGGTSGASGTASGRRGRRRTPVPA